MNSFLPFVRKGWGDTDDEHLLFRFRSLTKVRFRVAVSSTERSGEGGEEVEDQGDEEDEEELCWVH